MKLIKKIILTLGFLLCFIIVMLSGVGLYLYYHPEHLKPIIERSLSVFTGSSCRVGSLAYTWQPLSVTAREIFFEPLNQSSGFFMQIPFVSAEMAVKGPRGHRVLILENIKITDPYLKIFPGRLSSPVISSKKKDDSFAAGSLRRLIGHFFFSDISFQSGAILDGRISVSMGDQTLQVRQIHAKAVADQPLNVSLALDIKRFSDNMHFMAPKVNILTDTVFDITDLNFSGSLQATGMTLQRSDMAIRSMEMLSTFNYTHAPQTLDVDHLQVRCKGVAFSAKTGKPLPLVDIHLKAKGIFHLAAKELDVPKLSLVVVDMAEMDGTLQAEFGPKGTLRLQVGAASVRPEKGLAFLSPEVRQALKPLKLKNNVWVKGLLAITGINDRRNTVIEIRDVTVHVPRVKIETEKRNFPIEDIRVRVPLGQIDTGKKAVALPEIRLDTAGLKNLLFAVDVQGRRIIVTLQGEKTALVPTAAAWGLLPSDWDLTVGDAVKVKATREKNGPWQVQAELSLEDLVFENKAGSLMADKIPLWAKVEGAVDLERSQMAFTVALEAKAGEVLLDRYYLNLKTNPIIIACQGSYHFQKKNLALAKFQFEITKILPLEIQGIIAQDPAKGDFDFTVLLPRVPLQPIFHHFLQEPYQSEKPFLTNLDMGGDISAELEIRGVQSAWQISGRLGWHEGKFSTREGDISLKGIQLDLPVICNTRSNESPVEMRKGRLEIQSVTVPLLPEQSLKIMLNAGLNRMSVETPTIIQVPGGKIHVGALEINNLFGPDISIHTRVEFDSVKLQPVLSRVWTRPLNGTLTGVLDPVHYEKHTITSQGEITAEIFNGQIRIYDLGASGIFTPAPVYMLNAEWNNLLLSEMTTDTAFGKIDGVLEGHIRDFEFAYGQPQRFDLLLKTIKKKDIPQRISLKAVENIAQIGGGQSPFMGLAGGFASLFKTFPYQKIGIQAYLENDIFMINGIIKEGDTEYLVKRGSLSGVNVVNQNPDNRIRFKDMVKRIKRIAPKEGPVVK